MGFWELLETASSPILQVLILSALGAFLSTGYSNILHADTLRSLNKIVFMVFTPCLIFSNLSQTVTLQDILSWWFMPVNIGLTFLFGSIFGWILVKLIKPEKHLEGLLIASSSSGNLGNLMLIIVPAICHEKNSPFGNKDVCVSMGLSYASFSMALGGFFIWTYSYQLIRNSSLNLEDSKESNDSLKISNNDLEADKKTHLLLDVPSEEEDGVAVSLPIKPPNVKVYALEAGKKWWSFWTKVVLFFQQIVEELMAPPTLAAIVGLVFGAISWLRSLIVGEDAPLRVIRDAVKLLGDGTIPCITLILGGNLTRGLRTARMKSGAIVGVICVRFVILPLIGIGVVRAASHLGFLSHDLLYHYVLMIQFTLPPAMNLSTMTQLFDVAQEECSVLLMWTYLVAALALTIWPTIYMSILS